MYTIAAVDQQNSKVGGLVQAVCCGWIVSAQIWYYVQFRDLFRGVLASLLSRLWR